MENEKDKIRFLYAAAVAYADALTIIMSSPETKKREYLILPTHNIIGMILELCLKAIYIHLGGTEGELRQQRILHDLLEIKKLVTTKGLDLKISEIDQIIEIINNNYKSHSYRYMSSDGDMRHLITNISPIMQSLVDETALIVGMERRPEPRQKILK